MLGEWRDVTNEVSGMKQCKIVADTTGTYYIAFYSFSQANQNRFEIDDVSVVERSTVSVPGMPTSLNVSAATKGQPERHRRLPPAHAVGRQQSHRQ